jgi:hypothetical protein
VNPHVRGFVSGRAGTARSALASEGCGGGSRWTSFIGGWALAVVRAAVVRLVDAALVDAALVDAALVDAALVDERAREDTPGIHAAGRHPGSARAQRRRIDTSSIRWRRAVTTAGSLTAGGAPVERPNLPESSA